MNIRDIANLAGVSASTVSKVMNGKDKDISEETRKKVLEVIEREHYVPYFKFLDKAGMKNRLVGLILQKNNQEKERYIAVAERIARENNYGLVIGYSEDENDTKILCQDMILKKVSGILTEEFVNIADKREKGVIVNYNDTSGLNELNETIFYYKISEAVELAVENFVQEGHQKIACIVNKSQIGLLKDYKLAMQNKNMQINPAWMYIYEEIEEFGISQFIGESETAIICGTPEIACRVAGILEKRKTNIPEELSIIAIGEGKELQYVSGGITAIDFPIEEMVSEGTKCLFEMDKTGQKTDTVRMCSPQIIHRNSVAPPLREKQGEKIIVVGSMNIDVTIEADKIPGEGENQMASKVYVFPGGKGANQAVGVGKLGGQVYMIGCLGNDIDGKRIYTNLIENHVHMEGVRFDSVLPSGKAYIHVDKRGESAITVYAGANTNLSIKHLKKYEYIFEKAKYCLISTEIPESFIDYTVGYCEENEIKIILKPTSKVKDEILNKIDYFVPNKKELFTLVPEGTTIEEKAEILRNKGIQNVIVTLGEEGCYLKNDEYSLFFEGTGFEAVDTTGGADSFISALAVYLSEGHKLIESIDFAIYASGISVTRYGVQPALPDRKSVDIYEGEIHKKYNDRRRMKKE